MNPAQGVRGDVLVDPRPASDPSNDPAGGVPIHPLAGDGGEDRTIESFTDGEIDGPADPWGQRHGDQLAALAQHRDRAMPPLQTKVLDVDAQGLGDAQPIERQQRNQGVVPGASEAGGDKHGPELVAVQANSVRLIVHPRPPNMDSRRSPDQVPPVRRIG